MVDHPIIFSRQMVQSLLARRKTMTRRLAWREARRSERPRDGSRLTYELDGNRIGVVTGHFKPSPWQRVLPGDRLWVRENFALLHDEDGDAPVDPEHFLYAASDQWEGRVVPSIHMPRRASRLTLIVAATKIERVQQIPLRDVEAEGVEVRQMWLFGADGIERQRIGARVFGGLWSELHGRESWDANPEVVALTFRVVMANIDSEEARAAA